MNASSDCPTGLSQRTSEPYVQKSDERVLGPLRRAKWQVAVAEELAEPTRMELILVAGADGAVIDFELRSENPSSFRLLGCAFYGVAGCSLAGAFVRKAPMRDILFNMCRRALLTGSRQTVALDQAELLGGSLEVWLSEGGLTASVTFPEAVQRLTIAKRVLEEIAHSSNALVFPSSISM